MTASKPAQSENLLSARLKIWRGTSHDEGDYETFDITFEDGESVLDALVALRRDRAPDLAIRFSCFNANVCKECSMLVNGKVEYACIAKLQSGEIQLDPLPKRPLLRDLITDTLPDKEKLDI
jgi:succinate dehydrogenase/fumarate reductase-like Fe-S protein